MTTAQEIKAECERIWNARAMSFEGHVARWTEGGNGKLIHPLQGEAREPEIGASAKAFIRRTRKHWGPPPPAPYNSREPLRVPDWLRARYKENCPRNYKTLIASYGLTHERGKPRAPHAAGLLEAIWEAKRAPRKRARTAPAPIGAPVAPDPRVTPLAEFLARQNPLTRGALVRRFVDTGRAPLAPIYDARALAQWLIAA